jgi:hypothetical protein
MRIAVAGKPVRVLLISILSCGIASHPPPGTPIAAANRQGQSSSCAGHAACSVGLLGQILGAECRCRTSTPVRPPTRVWSADDDHFIA